MCDYFGHVYSHLLLLEAFMDSVLEFCFNYCSTISVFLWNYYFDLLLSDIWSTWQRSISRNIMWEIGFGWLHPTKTEMCMSWDTSILLKMRPRRKISLDYEFQEAYRSSMRELCCTYFAFNFVSLNFQKSDMELLSLILQFLHWRYIFISSNDVHVQFLYSFLNHQWFVNQNTVFMVFTNEYARAPVKI